MPGYKLFLTQRAAADLQRLDGRTRKGILNKLQSLADNAEVVKHEQLSGSLSLFSKLRVGDYRAIYSFSSEERIVAVHAVGHRTDIYRPGK